MSKFKFDIKTRDLSWEKTYPKICDKEKCNENGVYKAPKSRIKLNEYYYFCLNHVKEYNKSWDFYKGLSVNQIEQSMRKDTVWDRPTWPLGIGHGPAGFGDPFGLFGEGQEARPHTPHDAGLAVLGLDDSA